jgi:DNA-binding NarL/FixJ family response regulator
MGKISLIIVDDHTLLRETWSWILNADPNFCVVAEAGSGEDAIQLCRVYRPDIVMMDITLPGMNGLEATKQIRTISPATKVIGISLHNHPTYARQMIEAGASGYITKNSPREEMLNGLNEVSKGKKYLCSEIKNLLSDELVTGQKEKSINLLSGREREIVRMLKTGASSKEIADVLCISAKTVEVHRTNILKKLALRNVAALVNYANTHGL